MAGKKGCSGRKSHYDEMEIAEVVNLSISTIKSYLKNPDVPLKDKAEVAKHFAVKAMPQKIEGNLDLSIQQINYGDIAKSNPE